MYKKVIVYSVLAIVVLVLATWIWLTTPPGERFIAARLETMLSKVMNQTVTLEYLETNLFSRIAVTGLRVVSPDSSARSVIDIPSLRIRYSLYKVLFSDIEVDSVLILSLRIDLGRDSIGGFNFKLLNPSATPDTVDTLQAPVPFSINYISIDMGSVAFNDHEIMLGGALHGLTTEIHLYSLSRIEFSATSDSFEVASNDSSLSLGAFQLSGDWTSPNLTIDSLNLFSPDLNFTSQGSISFVEPSPLVEATIAIDASLPGLIEALRVLALDSLTSAEGQLEASLAMSGSFAEPVIAMQATIDDLEWGDVFAKEFVFHSEMNPVATAWHLKTTASWNMMVIPDSVYAPVDFSAEVTLADSILIVDQLSLALNGLRIEGNSEDYNINDPHGVNGSISIVGSITELADIVGNIISSSVGEVEGDVDIVLRMEGSILAPTLHISGKIPYLKHRELVLSNFVINSDYKRGVMDIDRFEGDLLSGHFSIHGDIEPATLKHNLVIDATNLNLNTPVMGLDTTDIGNLSLHFASNGKETGKGTYQLIASLTLDTAGFGGETGAPFTYIEVNAEIKKKKGAPKEIVWWDMENQIIAHAKCANVDFGYAQRFLPVGYQVGGNGLLEVTLSGRIGKPKLGGALLLHNGYFATKGEGGRFDSLNANISGSDTLIIINALTGVYKGVALAIVGEVKFRTLKWFELNAKLSAYGRESLQIQAEVKNEALNATLLLQNFDLALVQPLVPGLDALGGIANADIKVTGAFSKPEVNGRIEVGKLYLSPTSTEDSLLNCSLRVTINNQRVDIERLYGEFGGGTILASGTYAFSEDASNSNLKLHIENSRLYKTKDFLLRVKNGDLEIRQSDNFILVEGDVQLGESYIRHRYTPQMVVDMIRNAERPHKPKSKLLEKVKLDIRIRNSEDIWLDNNLARLKMRADLALTGSLARVGVAGRIMAIEGYVLYLDRKFLVEEGAGVLDFYDPYKINPNISLIAKATIKSFKSRDDTEHIITFSVYGELDKAVIVLASEPPEDVSDIISLLTLGITRRDLTGVDGKKGDVTFQEAVRERLELLTSRRISGYVASNVENLLGLKSFTIENNLFQFNRNWGPQLIASKKLSDRTELTYTTTIGRINEQGIKLAYNFTSRLAVVGETDQLGKAGIDFTYKIKLP